MILTLTMKEFNFVYNQFLDDEVLLVISKSWFVVVVVVVEISSNFIKILSNLKVSLLSIVSL